MDYRMQLYKKVALMYAREISFGQIVSENGLSQIYVYGAGEIADIIIPDLMRSNVRVLLYDKYKKGKKTIESGRDTYLEIDINNAVDIPKDNVPIMLTPVNNIYEIIKELTALGIEKSRLISVHLLADIGMGLLGINRLEELVNYPSFLITGGGERNKGAQSMVLTAIDGIRKKYEDALVFVTMDNGDNKDLVISERYNYIILAEGANPEARIHEIIPFVNGIIDVSGYALTSAKNVNAIKRCVGYFKLAYDNNIPLYIMPQSAGVLNVTRSEKNELNELLSYAEKLYIREKEGAEIIRNTIGLKNVKLSYDMVLINEEPNLERIMRKGVCPVTIPITTSMNAAIIPNVQNRNFISEKALVDLYQHIIDRICTQDRNVYIINHANDENLCEQIYRRYEKKQNVFIIRDKIDSVSFCNCIEKFDYVIASRYHAIVHSYKRGVPCIVIGWDSKYQGLLKIFGQENFLYDIRDKIDLNLINEKLDYLNKNYVNEGREIKETLEKVKQPGFFDFL